MTAPTSTRGFEIVTAVMLGLVSVTTALGAWQASTWSQQAADLLQDAQDARDVSVSQAVLADYARRGDTEASLAARTYDAQAAEAVDLDRLFYLTKVDIELTKATPGFADIWHEWQAAGFPADVDPLRDETYLELRDGWYQSYSHTALVAGDLASRTGAKSGILAQAALIQALALFLFGIAGVNRLAAVRAGVLGLGVVVFLAGLALALTAF